MTESAQMTNSASMELSDGGSMERLPNSFEILVSSSNRSGDTYKYNASLSPEENLIKAATFYFKMLLQQDALKNQFIQELKDIKREIYNALVLFMYDAACDDAGEAFAEYYEKLKEKLDDEEFIHFLHEMIVHEIDSHVTEHNPATQEPFLPFSAARAEKTTGFFGAGAAASERPDKYRELRGLLNREAGLTPSPRILSVP